MTQVKSPNPKPEVLNFEVLLLSQPINAHESYQFVLFFKVYV